jgi:hypothetical protein
MADNLERHNNNLQELFKIVKVLIKKLTLEIETLKQ